jgi:hypothetical protein
MPYSVGVARIPWERHPQPEVRRAIRVLRMVHELHKAGFQQIRIHPGLSASGIHWRCVIAPPASRLESMGIDPRGRTDLVARYTTGMENRYFGWDDAQADTAAHLAVKFIDRFPHIVKFGEGRDWTYTGWYVEMLGFAERGHLPVAYADWYGDPPAYVAKDGERELPWPPVP